LSDNRQELYKEAKFEAILKFLSENKVIEPKFDLSRGYTYPDLEKICPENTVENKSVFFMKLASAKVLTKDLFDIEIRCPTCKSSNFSTRYLCPFCQSIEIVKNLLVEHTNCGQISTKSNFQEESWFDFCPNCNKKYSEGGIRIVGKWFECSNCGKQIKNPMVTHFCRNCRSMFQFEDAVQHKVYSYSLSSEAKEEIENYIILPSEIIKILTNAKYTIKNSNVMKGKSGIEHKFDYISSNDKKTIALDIIVSSNPLSEIEIIKEQNKYYDTGIEIFLIVVPKLDEQAAKIAKCYTLKIIEASNKKDALSKLGSLIH
jgi:hypothetical protein